MWDPSVRVLLSARMRDDIHMPCIIYIYIYICMYHARLAEMSFDKIFRTACRDEFRQNLRSQSWSVFFCIVYMQHNKAERLSPVDPGISRGVTDLYPARGCTHTP